MTQRNGILGTVLAALLGLAVAGLPSSSAWAGDTGSPAETATRCEEQVSASGAALDDCRPAIALSDHHDSILSFLTLAGREQLRKLPDGRIESPNITDVKVQFSFKYQLIPLTRRTGLYLAFTQNSLWSLFDGQSAVFREQNYNPEIFYTWREDLPTLQRAFQSGRRWFAMSARVGISHQSNGREGPESLGWNRFGQFHLRGAGVTQHGSWALWTAGAVEGWVPLLWDRHRIHQQLGYGRLSAEAGFHPIDGMTDDDRRSSWNGLRLGAALNNLGPPCWGGGDGCGVELWVRIGLPRIEWRDYQGWSKAAALGYAFLAASSLDARMWSGPGETLERRVTNNRLYRFGIAIDVHQIVDGLLLAQPRPATPVQRRFSVFE